jgi:hypothetical protein
VIAAAEFMQLTWFPNIIKRAEPWSRAHFRLYANFATGTGVVEVQVNEQTGSLISLPVSWVPVLIYRVAVPQ